MMNVLFDGTACQGKYFGHYHDAAEYGKFLLREALDNGYVFDIVLYPHYYTDEELARLLRRMPDERIHYLNDQEELYGHIDEVGYDRFFSTLPYPYHDYPCYTPLIGVIHGLRELELPWDEHAWRTETRPLMRYLGRRFPRLVGNTISKRMVKQYSRLLNLPNAQFITVSQHTKFSLLNFFPGIDPESISVCYSPFSTSGYTPSSETGNHYLMLNANKYEKNVYRAIMTFDRLFSMGRLKGRRVVVTGCQNMNLMHQVKNPNRFSFLPYVIVEELQRLYRRAYSFVYPSLNEGFGYPPLRAMACGVPVIASSATSIPEVCANAALYFSPTNTDDLANRILQIDNNPQLRDRLIYEGHNRVSELLERQGQELSKELDIIFRGLC